MTITLNITLKIKMVIFIMRFFGVKFLLIGGAVLDLLDSREVKDWDIEVYGLSYKRLIQLLAVFGIKSNTVGKSFGVLKCVICDTDIDFSLPRIDSKTGDRHDEFDVEINSKLTPQEAAKRRDLTINAMGIDMLTSKLIDPYNGYEDYKNGVLKATDSIQFTEDPLRVLRVMQLLARKGKSVCPKLIELCQSMHDQFQFLPKERIFVEFEKLLLKSAKPSMGLNFLKDCGWINHFPALNNLIGCEQNPDWHPEGDVWTHTLMVVDNAAKLRPLIEQKYQLAFMLGALLHDVGKPCTTTVELRSPNHDTEGEPIALSFLEEMTNDKFLLDFVPKIVKYHMRAGQLHHSNAQEKSWRKLARQFERLDILGFQSKADSAGRTGRNLTDEHGPSKLAFKYYNQFKNENQLKPIFQGRHLIDLGLKPSPQFKTLLANALDMQDSGMNFEEIKEKIKKMID